MERRSFVAKSGCGMVGLALAAPLLSQGQEKEKPSTPAPAKPPRYKLEIEIFETRPDTWCHKKGDKFSYPEDIGKVCPWLLGSLHDFLILLQKGVTLPWKYENTPYAKVIDPEGVTSEYVRCPDPTSNLVAKIVRTRVG